MGQDGETSTAKSYSTFQHHYNLCFFSLISFDSDFIIKLSLSLVVFFKGRKQLQCDCHACLKSDKKSRTNPEHLWSHSTSGVSPSGPTGDCTLSKHDKIAPHLILHACSTRFLMIDRNDLVSADRRALRHGAIPGPLLSLSNSLKDHEDDVLSSLLWRTVAMSTDDGGVHCELASTEQWEAIHDHLKPPSVCRLWFCEVQITHHDILGDPLSKTNPSASQHARACTRCSVGGQICRFDGHTGMCATIAVGVEDVGTSRLGRRNPCQEMR